MFRAEQLLVLNVCVCVCVFLFFPGDEEHFKVLAECQIEEDDMSMAL